MASACLRAWLIDEGEAIGEESGHIGLEVNPLSGPVALETEDFAGRILILNRPQPEPEEWTYKELFKGKQRHFQLRLQGRFKSEPSQDVFLSVETPNAIPCETMRKKAASLMMKLCSKLVELRGFEFYYNMDWKKFPDSDILRPHCTIPLRGADFLVQTPDGEEPPSIMSNMDTMPAAPKKAVRLQYQGHLHLCMVEQVCRFVCLANIELSDGTKWPPRAIRGSRDLCVPLPLALGRGTESHGGGWLAAAQ